MNRIFLRHAPLIGVMLTSALTALPAAAAETAAPTRSHNPIAIGMFLLFVASTLLITRWAARKNNSVSDHYAAGGKITQDCNACHNLLAMDEANPKVLTDLGITEARAPELR